MGLSNIIFVIGNCVALLWVQLTSAGTQQFGTGVQIENHRLRSDGQPVEVTLKAYILDIEEVNCLSMDMTIEVYLEQFWSDPYFAENISRTENRLYSYAKENTIGESVWIPDSYIVNARKFGIRKNEIIQVGNRYMRSEIITVSAKCMMDFSLYPFDHQTCLVEFESYTHTIEDVFYKWKNDDDEKSVSINPSIVSVLPFFVMDVGHQVRNVSYSINKNETYSRATIDIHFRRHWNTYLESFYVPMTFFLSLSLLSLWLVYPRISAAINFFNVSLMNIFIQLYQNNSDLPKLYYKTAMSIYSNICYMFIYMTLFLNIYILFYIKTEEDDMDNNDRRERPGPTNLGINNQGQSDIKSIHYNVKSSFPATPTEKHELSNWLIIRNRLTDKLRRNSHWTLLSLFLLTKLTYWVTLLCIHYSS